MRSMPTCRIDYDAAQKMYQATLDFGPDEDGTPCTAAIIGAYLGWALDEIDRLREGTHESR